MPPGQQVAVRDRLLAPPAAPLRPGSIPLRGGQPLPVCGAVSFQAVAEPPAAASVRDSRVGPVAEEPSAAATTLVEEDVVPLPTLPSGRYLLINALSTWGGGGTNHVGLQCVEVISPSGDLLLPTALFAYPERPSMPQCAVDRLLESSAAGAVSPDAPGWLVPFSAGSNHMVVWVFPQTIRIAAIRLWNYNGGGRGSHIGRGCRVAEISLDDRNIFRGELKASSGMAGRSQDNYELLLFTEDAATLACVGATLQRLDTVAFPSCEADDAAPQVRGPPQSLGASFATIVPATGSQSSLIRHAFSSSAPPSAVTMTTVTLEILSSHGSHEAVGLSGLRFMTTGNTALHASLIQCIRLAPDWVRSTPLDALLDERPDTAMIARIDTLPLPCQVVDADGCTPAPPPPFTAGGLIVEVTFCRPVAISAVLVANLGIIDTYCGAKLVRLYGDNRLLTVDEGVSLRKAPAALGSVLLFQTLLLDAVLPNGKLLSQSVALRARTAIRRANLLSAAHNAEESAPRGNDAVVPATLAILPVCYAFTLTFQLSSPNAMVVIQAVRFFDFEGHLLEPDFWCSEPSANGVASIAPDGTAWVNMMLGDAGDLKCVAAFEEATSICGVQVFAAASKMPPTTTDSSTTASCDDLAVADDPLQTTLCVSLLGDDVVLYQGEWPLAALPGFTPDALARATDARLLAFTPQRDVLSRLGGVLV